MLFASRSMSAASKLGLDQDKIYFWSLNSDNQVLNFNDFSCSSSKARPAWLRVCSDLFVNKWVGVEGEKSQTWFVGQCKWTDQTYQSDFFLILLNSWNNEQTWLRKRRQNYIDEFLCLFQQQQAPPPRQGSICFFQVSVVSFQLAFFSPYP